MLKFLLSFFWEFCMQFLMQLPIRSKLGLGLSLQGVLRSLLAGSLGKVSHSETQNVLAFGKRNPVLNIYPC
jgi:hypothetical protein